MFNPVCRTVVAAVALLWATTASACNVPVFRYALERWQNDLYHVVIFHKGELPAADKARIDDLGKRSVVEGGTANLEITTVDVAQPLEPGFEDLWKTVPADAPLPFVLIQVRMGREKVLTVWQGPLKDADFGRLTHGRDRQEIVDRLLKGHSAVWVVLAGKDELATHNTVNLIETELNRLQDELPLPAGIGQPGSEVYSEIPLTLRFSVLVLRPGPDADILLPEIFRRIAPAAAAEGQPLVMPVFGRGRAVDVIPGDKVDEGTVEDLSKFICGACSCQVKEQNPGFDLLMSVSWNERLFAPDMLPPKDAPKKQRQAELVAIPSGSDVVAQKDQTSSSGPQTEAATPTATPGSKDAGVSWWQAWAAAFVVISLAFVWAGRAGRAG